MGTYRKLLAGLMAAALVVPVILAGCATNEISQETATEIRDVRSEQADEVIRENKDNPDFIILNVRTEREYVAGHIEGAVNIDVTLGSFYSEVDALDRNATYLVYCRTGNRSRTALAVMQDLEFTTIYHMVYGIEEWMGQDLPVVTSEQ